MATIRVVRWTERGFGFGRVLAGQHAGMEVFIHISKLCKALATQAKEGRLVGAVLEGLVVLGEKGLSLHNIPDCGTPPALEVVCQVAWEGESAPYVRATYGNCHHASPYNPRALETVWEGNERLRAIQSRATQVLGRWRGWGPLVKWTAEEHAAWERLSPYATHTLSLGYGWSKVKLICTQLWNGGPGFENSRWERVLSLEDAESLGLVRFGEWGPTKMEVMGTQEVRLTAHRQVTVVTTGATRELKANFYLRSPLAGAEVIAPECDTGMFAPPSEYGEVLSILTQGLLEDIASHRALLSAKWTAEVVHCRRVGTVRWAESEDGYLPAGEAQGVYLDTVVRVYAGEFYAGYEGVCSREGGSGATHYQPTPKEVEGVLLRVRNQYEARLTDLLSVPTCPEEVQGPIRPWLRGLLEEWERLLEGVRNP